MKRYKLGVADLCHWLYVDPRERSRDPAGAGAAVACHANFDRLVYESEKCFERLLVTEACSFLGQKITSSMLTGATALALAPGQIVR